MTESQTLPLEEAAPALDDVQADGVALPEDPPSSTDESQYADAENPAQERPKSQFPGFQKRIDKLTWKNHELEREVSAYRELIRNSGNIRQPEPTPEPVKNFDAPPSPLDYESGIYDAKYQQDFDRYIQHRTTQEIEQRFAQQRQQAEYEAKRGHIDSIERQYLAQNPDYTEARGIVLSIPEIVQNNAIMNAILESDNPPQIVHYLGLNPELALQIAEMNPFRAVKELGKIEAHLSGAKQAESKPSEPVQAFKTPAPVKPISGGKSTRIAGNIHEAKDFSEFKALRMKGIK